jgi:signal transduction histidine kinase
MSQLARRETPTSPASVTAEIDPMLKPLVDHYNDMVQRLAQLEDEHKIRQETLESQVRSAATSLLDQQRSLAKAEQLAAVGELAARLAHELRNPLAGMQMAITNLQDEVEDIEHIERLGLVAQELERITALLNGLLDQARLYPEPLQTIRLTSVVQELLTLARYQLPEHIGLEQQVPEELEWVLPENELRRSLLNLVLNACQAIGERRGVIRVLVHAEDGHLLIDVCDDGPGFPQTLLESGVRSFQTTRVNGTGLGLSSVQRFAQELHGTLQLHNHQPHGACVTLRIPPVGEKHV